jgi:hemerythrin-like domain-containing protein
MDNKRSLRKVDALDLLAREHDAIRQLFREYERLIARRGDGECKAEIVGEVCLLLSIHAQIEEEILYPAVCIVLGLDDVVDRALGEHNRANELIAKLDEMEPGDDDYDATVAVLGAHVTQHMHEEQEDMFPKLRLRGLDTAAMGRQMVQRRRALHDNVSLVGLPQAPASATT